MSCEESLGCVLLMDLIGFRDAYNPLYTLTITWDTFTRGIDSSNREEMSLSTAQPLGLVKKVDNGNRLALSSLEW